MSRFLKSATIMPSEKIDRTDHTPPSAGCPAFADSPSSGCQPAGVVFFRRSSSRNETRGIEFVEAQPGDRFLKRLAHLDRLVAGGELAKRLMHSRKAELVVTGNQQGASRSRSEQGRARGLMRHGLDQQYDRRREASERA